jgi:hypothetical protein
MEFYYLYRLLKEKVCTKSGYGILGWTPSNIIVSFFEPIHAGQSVVVTTEKI